MDQSIWSTSFWFVTAAGIFFTVLLMGLAPLSAWFFETPKLMPVLFWMSIGVLFLAMSIIPLTALRHQRRFGMLATIQIISIALGMITAVIIAINGGGAWALVIQSLIMHGSLAIMAFITSRFHPQITLKIATIKSHLQFGYTVMGATFVDFLRDSVRSFIIAKVLGTVMLGFYSLAFLFLNMPYRIMNIVMQDVIYTYLVKLKDEKELLRKMFLFLSRLIAILVFPIMGMIAIAHESVFAIILSDKWSMTGKLFMLAAPAAALHTLASLRIVFMQIDGRVSKNLRCSIELLLLELILLATFVSMGIEWAVIALALAFIIYLPRDLYIVMKNLDCTFAQCVNALLPTAAITAIGTIIYTQLVTLWGISEPITHMALAIALGVVLWLAAIALQYRPIKSEIAFLKTNLEKAA